jgi:lambda family phage portal protein
MSLPAMYRLIIRCLARDGEVLVRYLRGRQFGPFGLQLQILDIDRLDEERNEENVRGGAIKMGVQLNAYGKPTAYHLLRRNPGEYGLWGPANPRDYEVIPADQVVHLYVPDWPEQVRGFPWAHAAMTRLYHLGGFEEAAVVAARVGAAQMGMLERDPEVSGAASLASAADTESAAGEPQITVEAGTFQAIPYGWRMAEGWNPKYPDAAVEPFIRSTLRGIAASVGMAYHSLANDPSNVNFSTARVALLEERDMWASLQAWFVEHFCLPLFEEWRSMAALSGQLPQEYTGERFGEVRFQPRRWQWVDPRNEAAAQVEALEAKLTSRTRIAAQQGEDIEEIFDEIAAEEQMAADAGVTLTPAAPQPEPPPSPAAPEDDEPSEEDENGKSRPRLAVG